MGYHRAGFEVVGVDIEPQQNYPFEFVQADALTFPLEGFDLVHASPPCQAYSLVAKNSPVSGVRAYPDLVHETRQRLLGNGAPWVIENVVGSPLLRGRIMLCGAMFGLKTYRHRIFESDHFLWAPHHPKHSVRSSRAGHYKSGEFISVAGNCAPIAMAREVMGCGWMSRAELANAVPPAYTEYIGHQLIGRFK